MSLEYRQQAPTDDWIDYIVDKVREYYQYRKVILWGKYQASDDIRNRLQEKYEIDVAFYVDGDNSKVDNEQVFSETSLFGKASEYYVVIPIAFYQSVKDVLIRGGYRDELDFYYFNDCIIRKEPDYYEDAHGNKMTGKHENLKIVFSGFHSLIEIGENVNFNNTCLYVHSNIKMKIGSQCNFQNASIYIHSNAKVEIDDNFIFQNSLMTISHFVHAVFGKFIHLIGSRIYTSFYTKLKIEDSCDFKFLHLEIEKYAEVFLDKEIKIRGNGMDGELIWRVCDNAVLNIGRQGAFSGGVLCLFDNTTLEIGEKFTIEKNYRINLMPYTSAFIGDDCMFSYDVRIYSNDAHSIFDIITGENINSTENISKSRKVNVGNHVWVGMGGVLLYGACIGDGSIIGANSLVKGFVPNNCVAAGSPARIIRKNIAWCREPGAENIMDCGAEYICHTREQIV